MKHVTFIAMVDAIEKALCDEAQRRRAGPAGWIERERMAVAVEANKWADAQGLTKVTVDDVERVEGHAIGHVDYARKLALYVAEMVRGDQ